MEDSVLRVALVSQKPSELTCVSVDHGQIERPKVLVEWEVGEIVIDIEEECVLEVLWWSQVTNPIEFVCNQWKNKS